MYQETKTVFESFEDVASAFASFCLKNGQPVSTIGSGILREWYVQTAGHVRREFKWYSPPRCSGATTTLLTIAAFFQEHGYSVIVVAHKGTMADHLRRRAHLFNFKDLKIWSIAHALKASRGQSIDVVLGDCTAYASSRDRAEFLEIVTPCVYARNGFMADVSTV